MIALDVRDLGSACSSSAYLFQQDAVSATGQTVVWSVIFFFASAGRQLGLPDGQRDLPAGDAGDGDRLLLRRATAVGGIIGPWLYGHNIATGNRTTVFYGYLLGAGLMMLGALAEIFLGVDAEGAPLEDVASPITAEGS